MGEDARVEVAKALRRLNEAVGVDGEHVEVTDALVDPGGRASPIRKRGDDTGIVDVAGVDSLDVVDKLTKVRAELGSASASCRPV